MPCSYNIFQCTVQNLKELVDIPLLHSPLSPTKNPSGQIHAMVRVGKVSCTTHSCPAIHGLFTRQGF